MAFNPLQLRDKTGRWTVAGMRDLIGLNTKSAGKVHGHSAQNVYLRGKRIGHIEARPAPGGKTFEAHHGSQSRAGNPHQVTSGHKNLAEAAANIAASEFDRHPEAAPGASTLAKPVKQKEMNELTTGELSNVRKQVDNAAKAMWKERQARTNGKPTDLTVKAAGMSTAKLQGIMMQHPKNQRDIDLRKAVQKELAQRRKEAKTPVPKTPKPPERKRDMFDQIQAELEKKDWWQQGGMRERLRDQASNRIKYGRSPDQPERISVSGYKFDLYQDPARANGYGAWSYNIKMPDGKVENVEQAHDAAFTIADWIGEHEAEQVIRARAASQPKPVVQPRPFRMGGKAKKAAQRQAARENIAGAIQGGKAARAVAAEKPKISVPDRNMGRPLGPEDVSVSGGMPAPKLKADLNNYVKKVAADKRANAADMRQRNPNLARNADSDSSALEKLANGEPLTSGDLQRIVASLQNQYNASNYGGARLYKNAVGRSRRTSEILAALGVDAHGNFRKHFQGQRAAKDQPLHEVGNLKAKGKPARPFQ
jgi:hypothetical protein